MYDIRQFKPTLYFVVLLGLSGFCMAAEAPALWFLSFLAIALNAWLVYTGRFAPLPRWLANAITILAVLFIIQQILTAGGAPPLMFIGQFLVLLQIIKLFEQRANRDYAQLLVLSLLLMVAASINTASLLFGLLMIFYLIVSLYCCLIFHLKVETDRARAALAMPEDKISPATLRQDQRYLSRSMRRLTGLISVAAVSMAVLIFLFFPRGAGAGVLGQLQFKPATALTGFNDRVSFDQINKIKQNEEVAAHVTAWKNEQLLEGTETLLLRGYTLDIYGRDMSRPNSKPQWTRSRLSIEQREIPEESIYKTSMDSGPTIYKQKILLKPSGSRYLFALASPLTIRSGRQIIVRYAPADGSIQTEPVILPLEYEVTSLNAPTRDNTVSEVVRQAMLNPMRERKSDQRVLAQIREFTLQPEVTNGLAAQRSLLRPNQETNEAIARRIEHYLQANFTYSLDLTDSRELFKDADPVVAFLTKVKKGHCEYFASAMTLMCQSIEIPARMVVGFKCDEYNTMSGQYIVRQSHAHTWVEVLVPGKGWVAFDPTSGREASVNRTAGLWQSVKHFFDFLESKWAENVVAYESKDRTELISRLDKAMMETAYKSSGWVITFREFREWLSEQTGKTSFWDTSFSVLITVVYVMAAAIIGMILWYVIHQRVLRRRAARIGLDTLPVPDQLRLGRQLAFYDQLTQLLNRHRIRRPDHLTHLEFADSLVFLPNEAFTTIRRLTQLLYRVRFGHAKLTSRQQHHLEQVVARLPASLGIAPAPANDGMMLGNVAPAVLGGTSGATH